MKYTAKNSFSFLLFLLISNFSYSMECPAVPQQALRNYSAEVEAATAKIGSLRGPKLSAAAKSEAVDVMSKYPNSEQLYIKITFIAMYCSGINLDKSLSEREKAELINILRKSMDESTKTPISQKEKPKPVESSLKKKNEFSSEPDTPTRTVNSWINETLSFSVQNTTFTSIIDNTGRHDTPHYQYSTVQVPWYQIFMIIESMLFQNYDDITLRNKFFSILSEQQSSTSNGFMLACQRSDCSPKLIEKESDWQKIAHHLRNEKLASFNKDNGGRYSWGESKRGQDLGKWLKENVR